MQRDIIFLCRNTNRTRGHFLFVGVPIKGIGLVQKGKF